jgi:hypothetical protein
MKAIVQDTWPRGVSVARCGDACIERASMTPSPTKRPLDREGRSGREDDAGQQGGSNGGE